MNLHGINKLVISCHFLSVPIQSPWFHDMLLQGLSPFQVERSFPMEMPPVWLTAGFNLDSLFATFQRFQKSQDGLRCCLNIFEPKNDLKESSFTLADVCSKWPWCLEWHMKSERSAGHSPLSPSTWQLIWILSRSSTFQHRCRTILETWREWAKKTWRGCNWRQEAARGCKGLQSRTHRLAG